MASQAEPVMRETPAPEKPSRIYKPKVVQTAVIAGAILGKSSRRIAQETGIDPRTVRKILKVNEVGELHKIAGARLDAALPEAASVVCEKILINRDSNCAIAALRGRGVLKTDSTTVNLMAANGNVLIGMWPEFAGALPGTVQGEAQITQAAQSVEAAAVEAEKG